MPNTVMLLIMDGFGLAPAGKGNAVSYANTENLDKLFNSNPHSKLNASGEFVGLPDGQMGNSEVGHTNMGAGRVVWQELSNITNRIKNGTFFDNEALLSVMDEVKAKQDTFVAKRGDSTDGRACALHLFGLLSDGGIHSHINHLFALMEMAKRKGVKNVYIHPILDGRDVPPISGMKYIKMLEEEIERLGIGEIATISGRFYAMDRDNRWDRVETAYRLYTEAHGRSATSAEALLNTAYDNGETDEFVVPGIIANCKMCGCKRPFCEKKDHTVQDGDGIVFFNFRPDRAREITRAFVDKEFDGFKRRVVLKDIHYVCMAQYDASIENVSIAYPPQNLKNTLGEYVASKGLKQLRIAETEKYAHVTFFFSGGIEEPYPGEERILIPSPKVATYDLKPEMSAKEVTDAVIEKIRENKTDLIIMNLANCDMVGHTGVFDATVKSVETVDACVGRITEEINKIGGKLLITADHGNADVMLDDEDNIVTSHTTNLVPLIYVGPDKDSVELKDGSLCDLAPTLLTMMGLEIPEEMEGQILFK